MKTRLLLAAIFALSLGTSMYCTQKAPVVLAAQPASTAMCCGGDPTIPETASPMPTGPTRPKPTR